MSQASYHPLEEILRLIDRESPQPWYPRTFLRQTRADPDQLSALLDYLALERLIDKVPAQSAESGHGVVLTEQGQEVVRDPALMERLRRGEALREGDTGAAIRQDMRSRGTPYVTYALIAANVLLFLMLPPDNKNPKPFLTWTANAPAVEAGQWWRLLTCAFLHWNFLHIGSNMFSLWSVGSFVEQAWGKWRYLLIYLVSGWTGSCLGMAFHDRGAELAGASGAVCGVLGAVGAWFVLYGRHIPRDFARNGLWQVVTSVVLIGIMGVMIPNISNWGHLGGGIGGILTALALHVGRFGVGGMSAPPLRWGVAAVLLVAIPLASYLQMKNTWARGGPGAARRDRRADPDDEREQKNDRPAKDLPDKPQDAGEAGAFYRNYGKELSSASVELRKLLKEMPRSPADVKDDPDRAKEALGLLAKDRQAFVTSKEELEQKGYKDAYVEQARKEALAVVRAALALIDAAAEQLKAPTNDGEDTLIKLFKRLVERTAALDKRLKPME